MSGPYGDRAVSEREKERPAYPGDCGDDTDQLLFQHRRDSGSELIRGRDLHRADGKAYLERILEKGRRVYGPDPSLHLSVRNTAGAYGPGAAVQRKQKEWDFFLYPSSDFFTVPMVWD